MSCACVPTNDITPPPAKSAKFLSRQRSNPDLDCFIALSDFHAPYAQLVELPDLRRVQHPRPGHPERKEAPYPVINRCFHYLIVSAIVSCDGYPSCLFRRLPARAWFDVLFYSRPWGGAGPPGGGAQVKVGGRQMPDLPVFRRHTIYEGPPAERMSCIVGDLDSDGVPQFIISTRNLDQLHWFGRTGSGAWQPHLIDDTFPSISVGGALVDLTGNGRARPDRRHQRSRRKRCAA